MENLSDLDDCINTLEQLQLTLDFESSTVKRNPKVFNTSYSVDYPFIYPNNRVDLVSSNQHRSDHNSYDSHLPDITKTLNVYPSEGNFQNGDDISNTIFPDQYHFLLHKYPENVSFVFEPHQKTDFKSLSVRRPKLTTNMSVENDLFSVPECDVTDFPPPPPPINIDQDNYIRTYAASTLPKQQSSNNSSSPNIGNTNFQISNRKYSTNSLKLSPKPMTDPFFSHTSNINNNNNNTNSAGSSQSNLSGSTEESKNDRTFPNICSEIPPDKPIQLKQTVVRFFSSDKTTKALIITENMTIESVIKILMEKNFWIPSLKSAIVEKVPSLKMERFFEEHEYLLDCVNSWPATCSNMIFFEQREDIYGLFENAKNNLGDNYSHGAMDVDAIKNLFINLTALNHDYQDYIYIKKPAENSWKRKFCLLNHRGIMTIPKKKSKLTKNQCNVMSFNDKYFLYTTTGGWTREWDAPTPFGFAFKPYSVVDPKSVKVLMFCASDEVSMRRWCSNLRLCKYKNQILNNYQNMQSRSTYCSNLYTSEYQINRTLSLSPALSNKYDSRCSLPTASLGQTKFGSNKFKF